MQVSYFRDGPGLRGDDDVGLHDGYIRLTLNTTFFDVISRFFRYGVLVCNCVKTKNSILWTRQSGFNNIENINGCFNTQLNKQLGWNNNCTPMDNNDTRVVVIVYAVYTAFEKEARAATLAFLIIVKRKVINMTRDPGSIIAKMVYYSHMQSIWERLLDQTSMPRKKMKTMI